VRPEDIDRHVGVAGFGSAMQEVGWLLVDDNGVLFPNFDRHNGTSAKSRALTTERKRTQRVRGAGAGHAAGVTSCGICVTPRA